MRLRLVVAAVLAAAVASAPAPAPAAAEEVTRDLGAHFPGFRSTLVLRDVAAGRTLRHDPARGATRPASKGPGPRA
jgi:hypothetical protein